MITTVIFDLSEVFLTGLKGTEDRINAKFGINLKNPTLMFLPEAKKLFHGDITEEEYWQAAIDTYHIQATVPELMQLIRENFKEIEGTRAIVEKLHKNGYTLGLLSVHAKEWIEYCEKMFDFHKLFHSRLYSFEIAVSKPDKRAYELLVEKMKVKPSNCIFIDDSKENLLAAEEIGITTILFKNASKLDTDLRKSGISLK